MLPCRKTWLTAALLVLGCFLLSAAPAKAGEKKKTTGPKAGAPLLSKAEELSADDEKDTKRINSVRKSYPIKLTEGKTYQIDMKSKDVDSYLRLEDSAGKEVAFDDDGGGFPDARITYKAPKTDDYKIIATTFGGGTGKFTLTVVEGTGGGGTGAGVSQFTAKPMELKLKAGKASYTGELTDKDGVVKGHFYKVFTVKLEAGKTYRIDHKDAGDDPAFDPFLFLEDSAGKTLANDDDSGGGLNSRIIYKAAKTDTYRVICTTLPAKQTGKFTVEINPGTDAEEKEAALKERAAKFAASTPAERKAILGDTLKLLQSKNGKLTIGDARFAFQLANAVEDIDNDLAKSTYKDFIKVFSAADNPQLAEGATKDFERALKKVNMIGAELVITGKTVDGKDFDLKNMKGKVVLVDFWATWCGPCIAEMPNMEAAYKKYHRKGFDIIGVSLDRNDDAISKFTEDRKIPWPSINVEDSKKLADLYEVNAIPFPVLVDAQGRVVSLRARGPQLEQLLEKLLGEKK